MNNQKQAEQAALLYMKTDADVKLLPHAMQMQAASDYEAGYASALETVNAERQFAFMSITRAFNYLFQDGNYGREQAVEILSYAIERLK